MKHQILTVFILFSTVASAQFFPAIGVKFGVIQSDVSKVPGIYGRSQYSGLVVDYYDFEHRMGTMSAGFCLRGFGTAYSSKNKVRPGYSLEIGAQQFSSYTHFVYNSSSTADPDSIVNDFDGERTRTNYTTVQFKHFFDLHWNVNERVKWTNSIGVGLQALVRARSLSFPNTPNPNDVSMVNNSRPLTLTFTYDLMFTEYNKRVDIAYFFTYDFYSLNLFRDDLLDNPLLPKLGDLAFVSIGVRFIPHPDPDDAPPRH